MEPRMDANRRESEKDISVHSRSLAVGPLREEIKCHLIEGKEKAFVDLFPRQEGRANGT